MTAQKHLPTATCDPLDEIETITTPRTGCPCEIIDPCHPMCGCVEKGSSVPCIRCCKYGSPEQKKRVAIRIAALDNGIAIPRELFERLTDAAIQFQAGNEWSPKYGDNLPETVAEAVKLRDAL